MNPSYDRQSILKCGYSSHGDYDDRLRDRAITDRREDPKKIFEDRRDDDEDDDDDYRFISLKKIYVHQVWEEASSPNIIN